eukprot:gene2827-3512_t
MSTESLQLDNYEHQLLTKRDFSWSLTSDFLRFLRRTKLTRPFLVSDYGYRLITQYFKNLNPSESWDIIEQVLVCSLECNKVDRATELYHKLVSKFGQSSVRCQRLSAMIYECQGEFKDAVEIYSSILEQYPADAMAMKRQISIFISQGNYYKAIQLLNSYLQIFMTDFEAWLELSSLHIKLLSYKSASFCYEEIILSSPINYVFYVKHAEILYSQGGLDNYILALKYYTHSLELNSPLESPENHPPTNLSSIYGIIMCIFSFCNTQGGGVNKLKEAQLKLMEWAQKELLSITNQYSPEKLNLVKAFIKSTSINTTPTATIEVDES